MDVYIVWEGKGVHFGVFTMVTFDLSAAWLYDGVL